MGTYTTYKNEFDEIYSKYSRNDAIVKVHLPITTHNSAWSLEDLGDKLQTTVDKINAIRPLGVVRSGNPYIPNDSRRIKDCCPPEAQAEVEIVAKDLVMNHRRYAFYGTRIEAIMYQVLRDFIVEKRTGHPAFDNSFKFPGYPLKVVKGKETDEVIQKYGKEGITNIDEVFARAARDFYFSSFIFTHLRNFALADLSICASTLCLTTLHDYVGSSDDPEIGGHSSYKEAMLDGYFLYKGSSFAKILDSIIMATTFIKYKTDETNRYFKEKVVLPPTINRKPTPCEFWETRWWDGAMAPFFRMPLLFASGAGIPCTKEYSPTGTETCPFIRMGVDSALRYNELIDVNHDINGDEIMNEIHVAGRYGGFKAVQYYGLDCAAAVDDGCVCKCLATDQEHDYGTDVALGSVCWPAIVPHYRAVTQFAETRGPSEERYRNLVKESKHAAFITCRYPKTESKIGMLHDENWNPIYRMEKLEEYQNGECHHCQRVSTWLITRCLYRDRQAVAGKDVDDFVTGRIHLVDDVEMKGFWGDLVTVIAGDSFPLEVVQRCVTLINKVWELYREAAVTKCPEDLKIPQVEVHGEFDKVLMFLHQVNNGHILRRAVVGAFSSIAEHTDIAVYQRILESCF